MESLSDRIGLLLADYWRPLNRQEKILLSLRPGAKYLSRLRTELGLRSLSGIERDLNRLVRDGFIVRDEKPDGDKRSPIYYSLTENGASLALLLWLKTRGVDLRLHASVTDAGY